MRGTKLVQLMIKRKTRKPANAIYYSYKNKYVLPRVKSEAHIMKDSECLTSSFTRYYWKQLFTFATQRCLKKVNRKGKGFIGMRTIILIKTKMPFAKMALTT